MMDLERIKVSIPISTYVSKYVRLVQKSRYQFVGLCPFHKEKTPSFTVSDDKCMYHCFGCKASGDIFKFVQDIQSVDFKTALAELARLAGIAHDKPDPKQRLYTRLRQFVAEGHTALLANQQALQYLYTRGINDETIVRYQLGLATKAIVYNLRDQTHSTDEQNVTDQHLGINGLIADRILFPIKFAGTLVGFGARKYLEHQSGAKYINSKDSCIFSKKSILYGEPIQSTKTSKSTISQPMTNILVEGYIDALLIAQNTPYGAYAVLGTAVSEQQLQYLLTQSLVLCFDSDEAGHSAMLKTIVHILKLFKPGMMVKIYQLPYGQDPSDAVLQGTFDLNHAVTLSTFIFNHICRDEIISVEQRLARQQKLARIIQIIVDPTVKQAFAEEFDVHWKLINTKVKKQPYTATVLGLPLYSYLLAFVIQHPDLLEQIEEEFANLILPDHALDTQTHILARNWDHHTCAKYRQILLPKDIDVMTYWTELVAQYHAYARQQELQKLEVQFAETMSQEIWHKMQALKKS